MEHAAKDPFAMVRPRVLVAGIAVLVAAVFLPTLGFDFVYDDHWTLLENGFLRQPSELPLLLGPEAVERNVPDAFRPVAVVFDLLSYQLLGESRVGHHALSVALHVGASLLLFRWLGQLGAPLAIRVASLAIFGTLAIHSEAVAVISYREDLLACGLGLAACVAAGRGLEAPSRAGAWWVAAALLQTAAVGAKMSAAPLPLVWLLAVRLAPWRAAAPRRAWIFAGALAVGTVLVLAHRYGALGGIDPYGATPRVFANRVGLSPVLAASLQIHATYAVQMILPTGLSPEYVDYGASWLQPATILCGFGLLSLAVASAANPQRRPIFALAVIGALLLAGPTANVAGMPNMRADRFMYLPSVPVCVGLAVLLVHAGRRVAARIGVPLLTVAPLCMFVVVQGAFAQGASAVYRSDSRLWEIALRRAPGSARAHAVRGEQLTARLSAAEADLGLRSRAWAHCEMATRLDPLDAIAHLCHARLASAQRRWQDAHDRFSRALALGGVRSDRALVALASTTLDIPTLSYEARKPRAFAHLERAVREYPYVPEVAAVAGHLNHRLGRPQQATVHYRRARDLRPERWDVVLWGLELELDLGHPSAARQAWVESRRLLKSADPIRRNAVARRLHDADSLFTPTPFDTDLGVTPDDP